MKAKRGNRSTQERKETGEKRKNKDEYRRQRRERAYVDRRKEEVNSGESGRGE